MTVARGRSGARVVSGSIRPVAFGGDRGVVIPRGADVTSDTVRLRFRASQNLAASVYLRGPSGPLTEHSLATEAATYGATGERTSSASDAGFGAPARAWPLLTGVDVEARRADTTVVALGDSITDGLGSQSGRRPGERNTRYPDFLARRVLRTGRPVSVVNAGIGGNQLRLDAPPTAAVFGPSALSRLESDVIATPGATDVIVLEGINDLGQNPPASPGEEIGALRRVIVRLHRAGLRVSVGTLTPAGGSSGPNYGSAEANARRTAVNRWIRTSGEPDQVVDFDAAVRDPHRPSRMRPVYDSGDHLHPNARGYERMAAAVALRFLLRAPASSGC